MNIDPIIFSLGPLQIRWYGLMYVVGFLISSYLLKILVKKGFLKISIEKIDSLMSILLICMFIGARFFYVVIYNWKYYGQHLEKVFSVWEGGLSYHGALAGLLVGGLIFAKKNKISWAQVMDCVALAGAQGVFWGRIGNFINGELYGRITDSPLGVIFLDGGPYPRHPSQLYEGVWEGVILTLIFWVILKRVKNYGTMASLYLMGYALGRFCIEFFREADHQLGYYFHVITMGQILCIGMFLLGVMAFVFVCKNKDPIVLN